MGGLGWLCVVGGVMSIIKNKNEKIKMVISLEMIIIGLVLLLINNCLLNDNINNILLIIILLCISTGEVAILICLILKTKTNFRGSAHFNKIV